MLIKTIINNIYKKLKQLYEHKLDGFSFFEICIYVIVCGIVYTIGSQMITMVQKRLIISQIDMLIMNQETHKVNINGIEVDIQYNNGESTVHFKDTTTNKKNKVIIDSLQQRYMKSD